MASPGKKNVHLGVWFFFSLYFPKKQNFHQIWWFTSGVNKPAFNILLQFQTISPFSFHAEHCFIVLHCRSIHRTVKRGDIGSYDLSSAGKPLIPSGWTETDHPGHRSRGNNSSCCGIQISLTISSLHTHNANAVHARFHVRGFKKYVQNILNLRIKTFLALS